MVLKLPQGLYGLVDDSVRPEVPVPEKARWALEGGASVLQLRLERTADPLALRWIESVVGFSSVPVIINDRVDLCLVGRASGVHLGTDDLPISVARSLLGPDALIGATVRNLDEIVRAQAHGADHVGLGPIFRTSTKVVDAPVLGVFGFRAIVARSPLPVVGIAGITLQTIGEVALAGATAAAVASDLFLADDVVERARALSRAFARHQQ